MLVNPSNSSFQEIINEGCVDKSGFISYVNSFMDCEENCLCVTRGRRLGKTVIADMLNAYYSKGSDSKSIFDQLDISKDPEYLEHLNKHDVLYFDMPYYGNNDKTGDQYLDNLNNAVINALKAKYPKFFEDQDIDDMSDALSLVAESLNTRFVVIIDEWDYVFRQYPENTELHRGFLSLLNYWFKCVFMCSCFSLVYMTGIFPIWRYADADTLNNFLELTPDNTARLGQYYGFTEDEVKIICKEHDLNFEDAKIWYKAFRFDGLDIYNPNSVMEFAINKRARNYLRKTSSMIPVYDCISRDLDGLQECIINLIAGKRISFEYVLPPILDPKRFSKKQNVLYYLAQIGYLDFDEKTLEYFTPNYETKQFLLSALHRFSEPAYLAALNKSDVRLKPIL